jgi:hypothetical protein
VFFLLGAPLSLSHLSYLVVSFVDLNPQHNGFLVEKKDISIGTETDRLKRRQQYCYSPGKVVGLTSEVEERL